VTSRDAVVDSDKLNIECPNLPFENLVSAIKEPTLWYYLFYECGNMIVHMLCTAGKSPGPGMSNWDRKKSAENHNSWVSIAVFDLASEMRTREGEWKLSKWEKILFLAVSKKT